MTLTFSVGGQPHATWLATVGGITVGDGADELSTNADNNLHERCTIVCCLRLHKQCSYGHLRPNMPWLFLVLMYVYVARKVIRVLRKKRSILMQRKPPEVIYIPVAVIAKPIKSTGWIGLDWYCTKHTHHIARVSDL